jgi:predicted nucleic acid-binding protein
MIRSNNQDVFPSLFIVLPADGRIVPIYLDLMQTYNLLSNDSLIIATAKLHGIPALASFDANFLPACKGESIRLIRTITDVA